MTEHTLTGAVLQEHVTAVFGGDVSAETLEDIGFEAFETEIGSAFASLGSTKNRLGLSHKGRLFVSATLRAVVTSRLVVANMPLMAIAELVVLACAFQGPTTYQSLLAIFHVVGRQAPTNPAGFRVAQTRLPTVAENPCQRCGGKMPAAAFTQKQEAICKHCQWKNTGGKENNTARAVPAIMKEKEHCQNCGKSFSYQISAMCPQQSRRACKACSKVESPPRVLTEMLSCQVASRFNSLCQGEIAVLGLDSKIANIHQLPKEEIINALENHWVPAVVRRLLVCGLVYIDTQSVVDNVEKKLVSVENTINDSYKRAVLSMIGFPCFWLLYSQALHDYARTGSWMMTSLEAPTNVPGQGLHHLTKTGTARKQA